MSPNQSAKLSFKDFDIIKYIGRGAFGKVFLVRRIRTCEIYAMKLVPKNLIKTENSLSSIKTERSILAQSNHPFIVKLHYAFQNSKFFAFVMDYVPGGSLANHMKSQPSGRLKESVARYYVAQVLLALENLHNSLKAVYRDLKPENILIDIDGNLKLSDFGLAKSRLISWQEKLSDRLWNTRVSCTRNYEKGSLQQVSRLLESRMSSIRTAGWTRSVSHARGRFPSPVH